MASFWFLKTLEAIVKQDFDIEAAALGVKLLMGGNDCVSKRATAVLIADVSLDEYDGVGYSEYALASHTIVVDATNFKVKVNGPAGAWGSEVYEATNPAVGYLVYDITSGRVIGYSTDGFPLNGDGGPFSFTPNTTDGLLAIA